MTDDYLKADPLKFEQALAIFSSASAAYQNIMAFTHTPEMEVSLQQFIRAEDELLALPAPNIDGVIEKLLIIWAEDLAVSEPDPTPKMRVIGDLRRLASLHDHGVEPQNL